MIFSSQLSPRARRAARSLTKTRAATIASAATRTKKNQLMRPRSAKLRGALGEKGGDAFRGLRARRLRSDALALENHLRLEGAEGAGHEALGRAKAAPRPAAQPRPPPPPPPPPPLPPPP